MVDTVYHYCSMGTFFSIMRNQCIWLTSMRDSNDYLEGIWARQRFESFRQSAKFEDFTKAIQVLNVATHSGKNLAGICFSAERDLLSQWRGYADDGQGFSIGFSAEALRSIARNLNETHTIELELEEIEYKADLDTEFVKYFKEFVDKQEYSANGSFSSMSLDNARLPGWVKRVSLMKNVAFKEENEFRLFTLDAQPDVKGFGYQVAGSKLSPYLEVSLQANLGDIITSVVIGPKNTSEKHHIRDFVQKCGFTNVYVSKSRASYR